MEIRNYLTPPRMVLAAIILVAAVVRFWDLGGPRMSADESLHYFPEMQNIHQLPFEQQRIHPTDLYHATSPGPVGHPLFAVQVANVVMRVLEPTAAVGRGVMVVSGLLLVGLAYLIGRDLYSEKHGLIASAITAFLPLAVRYQRTLYLDPMYSLLTAAWFWCLLRAFGRSANLGWLAAAGVLLGLTAATKTSAPFLMIIAVGYVAYCWWQGRTEAKAAATATKNNKKKEKRQRRSSHQLFPEWFYGPWSKLVMMLGLGLIVFLVFVSPRSYFEAIRNPVDTGFQNKGLVEYLIHLWAVRDWLAGVSLYLWTPPVLIAAAVGFVVIGRRWRLFQAADLLLILWLIAVSPLLLLHTAGLSGEHGHLSFIVPVALLAAVGIVALPARWLVPAVVVVLLPMIPATILYGLRLVLIPYTSYLNAVDGEPAP